MITRRWSTGQLATVTMLLCGSWLLPAHAEATTPAPSPKPPTLGELLDEARRNSPGLQAKRRAYEAARARIFAAWLPNDPEIGTDVEGQSSLFRMDRANNEYMAMQTVPFPTTLWLRGQAAAREAQMAFQEYQEKEREVSWHIEQPYHELFLARKTLLALEGLQVVINRLSKAAQARYEANEGSQHDLLKARIEASKLDIDLVQWREKVHLAEAHLSHILNRPLSTSYELSEEPRTDPPVMSAAELERVAVRVRPELKALEWGIKRAKTSRYLAMTSWLPDITGRIEARQFSGEDSIREYDTFLGLTVPVWSILKGVGGGWKGAGRDVQAAEATYAEIKNEVLLAIHEASSKVHVAAHALTVYEQSILPQAKQQVEVALTSYEGGRADILTLIDAQRTLRDAEMAYYTFAADYEVGWADLRRTVGDDLAPAAPGKQGGAR